MANPWAGEVALVVDGQEHICKLTLGALAELEAALGAGSVLEVAQRFESGAFATRDILAVLVAGLRGGGWQGTAEALLGAEIAGGPVGAAKVAAELLARAFGAGPDTGAGDG
ncbi:gene transfer agent family protein [Pseudoruegeria sp. SHC-113]|uniref:gene transfer agent family protein n=1 Tax=Pseudoruegeria sp. SHC-113 TaxID=2855439 RepID=UPI0021BBA426|nr:gene transfer agent family protein [Pseudoruegeria sp. SHC-113]MCT8160123.1 gene transfer agent family protein [Pseudoruegeria sp. SHC-113]